MRPLLAIALLLSACRGEYRVGGKDEGPGLDLDSEPSDTGEPAAKEPLYAHTRDRLFQVEPTTGEVKPLGQFRTRDGRIVSMADLAIDLRGRLVGGAFDADHDGLHGLYAVHPRTGRVRHLCDTDVSLTAMTFLADGRLVTGGERVLSVVDLRGGCASSTLLAHDDYVTSGDIVGLPDGRLYWTVVGIPRQADDLVVVDPEAPDMAYVMSRLAVAGVWGLGFVERNGSLYGFTDDGRVVKVHPNTGQATELSSNRGQTWWGATTNPVLWGE